MVIDRNRAELATGVLLLIAIIYMFWETFSFTASTVRGYPGAGFYPRIVLTLAGALTVFWIVQSAAAMRASGAPVGVKFELGAVSATILASVAFVFGLETIGFELTLTGIAFALLLPRLSSWWLAALVAVATTAACYLTFVAALGAYLPMLFLPEYIQF